MFSNRFCVVTNKVRHNRLGHPQMCVVDILKKNNCILSKKILIRLDKFVAVVKWQRHAYYLFWIRVGSVMNPISIIHYDLWGKAPILSHQNFHYYVIFVDECMPHTWYYPLKHKSDFLQCFIEFHKHIEKFFDKSIKMFQSDGRCEFSDKKFLAHLSSHVMIYQLACPITSDWNGFVERKHCNITKLGRKPDYSSLSVLGVGAFHIFVLMPRQAWFNPCLVCISWL